MRLSSTLVRYTIFIQSKHIKSHQTPFKPLIAKRTVISEDKIGF